MNLIALIVLAIVAVVFLRKAFGSNKGKDENSVAYVCTRCESMYYTPDIPLNSKCPRCGGGVQPY